MSISLNARRALGLCSDIYSFPLSPQDSSGVDFALSPKKRYYIGAERAREWYSLAGSGMASWAMTGQLGSRRLHLGQVSATREDSFPFLLYQSLRGHEAWATLAILSPQQEDLWEPTRQKTEPRKEIQSLWHHLSIWISQCVKPAYPVDFYTRPYISSFFLSLSGLGVLSLLGIIYPNIKICDWLQYRIPVKSAQLL